MDGSDDGYSTATFSAGTLTADMDCFAAVNRSSTQRAKLFSVDATRYFGYFESGGAATHSNVGTPTTYVNGVLVADATALNTALPVGTWKVLEMRNLNLSTAGWTQLVIGSATGYLYNGDLGGVILCPAQTDAIRDQIRRWLGARVGLSL